MYLFIHVFMHVCMCRYMCMKARGLHWAASSISTFVLEIGSLPKCGACQLKQDRQQVARILLSVPPGSRTPVPGFLLPGFLCGAGGKGSKLGCSHLRNKYFTD